MLNSWLRTMRKAKSATSGWNASKTRTAVVLHCADVGLSLRPGGTLPDYNYQAAAAGWTCTQLHRRLEGSLGANVNRRSASFCLRFRFVRGVRASGRGEAASACEGQSIPAHAGVSSGKFFSCSRSLCEAQDVVYMWVLKQNGSKSVARRSHCVCFTLVL